MLLQALVACAGVTMRAVATSLGIDVSGSVHAEGELDFRGTLSVDREAAVGFRAIRAPDSGRGSNRKRRRRGGFKQIASSHSGFSQSLQTAGPISLK